MKLHLKAFLLAVGLVLFVVSCQNGRDQQFAVLLWPPEGSGLEPGSVIRASLPQNSEETVRLRPEEDATGEVESFRVRLFQEQSEAERYREEYAQYATVFARAQRQALPIREAPREDDSRVVYRLRENELMKVLGRTDSIEQVGGLSGYWYEVLTEDGSQGWVFSYHLEVVSGQEPTEPAEEQGSAALDTFFGGVWRPIYFAEMIDTGHIRLDRFRKQYGLFPNRQARELRLSLPQHETTFSYSDIVDAGRNRFSFTGSSFQLVVRSDKEISIQYTVDGQGHNLAMQTINADIEQERQNERQERARRYQRLQEQGGVLASNAYGELRFISGRTFEWNQYERLVPRVIPEQAANSGTVHMDVFITSELEEDYDGAFRLSFRGVANGEGPHFLYGLRPDGVRLVYVPPEQVKDDVIRSEPLSPLILFFSAQGR
jgi:hypothetical protein